MDAVTEKKRRITIHLYDTDLSVNIPANEEELYRKGAKLISDVMNSYSTHFKGIKSEKEIMYMALIDIALRYEKEADRKDFMPLNDILSKLTSEIEDAMK